MPTRAVIHVYICIYIHTCKLGDGMNGEKKKESNEARR